ncbi:MAG: inositol monophosphatase family protein [Candidatus Woesearchaeota archaeon]|jgi:myo-inositol-1(or 4)-monophosphatase
MTLSKNKRCNMNISKKELLNLDEAEKFIQQITKKAGKIVSKLYGKVDVKYTKQNIGDVVTKADLLSNDFLVSSINKKYPFHGIISEELKPKITNSDYTWIIDPLDGTRNYSTKTPIYGVIVALAKKDKVIMGAICLPEVDELYFARIGKGAYLNGKKIKCSTTKEFKHSYGVGKGFHNEISSRVYVELFKYAKKKPFWINTLGCGAFALMLIASGRRDWCINPRSGGVWDFAGAVIILQEAGCKVTNIEGKEWTTKDNSVVVANQALYKELMNIVKMAKKQRE